MAYTVERVTREIGDLQLSINRMLTDLSQQLREESSKLAEIRLAIDTENSRLKELHDIDGAIRSLCSRRFLRLRPSAARLLRLSSTSEKPIFRLPWRAKHEEWNREQADHDARTKKTREREEEEYAYKLSLKRRRGSR